MRAADLPQQARLSGPWPVNPLLPRLRQRLAQAAPGVRLRVLPLGPDAYQPLLAGEADLGVAGFRVPPAGIALRALGAEPYVCLVRSGHPLATSGWGLEAYLASEHLLISPIALTLGHVDQALAALGHTRRLGCTVPHFLLTPHLLAESDLVATLFASVAEAFAHPAHGLVPGPAPFPIPPFPIAMAHPEWLAKDPAQRWLQAQVVAAWGAAASNESDSGDALEA